MKQEQELPRLAAEPTEPDDIEIIEVVGMEDEAGPACADVEEVVVSFDGDAAAVPPPPARARRDDDAHERLLRLRADFENLHKRVEREREEYYRHATGALVSRLLPVLDNLERALQNMRRTGNDSLSEGVALIQRQLLDELRREGLRPLECVGQPFDPALHEAVATREDPKLPANVVVEELQRGYYFEDRLLRPALVRVSVHGPSGAARAGSEET